MPESNHRRRVRSVPMATYTYSTHPTPVGQIMSIASPYGLAKIVLCENQFAGAVADYGAKRGEHAGVATQLAQYFAGQRRKFELALDWGEATGAYVKVQHALLRIPYAHTTTYAQLAVDAGLPGAARAAGTACAKNPLPIVVPCHRVVRADGQVGQYAGGVEMKQYLLDVEARHG